jgi:hypothetical protein
MKKLELKDVTNMYAQFHLLSKKDKKIVNDEFERKMALKHLFKTLI